MIQGSRRVNIFLCGETKLHIENALYSSKSHKSILNFKDVRLNGYYILDQEMMEALNIF